MSWRVFFGGLLVVVGAGFLLDQLDILEFGTILDTWWPLILILIGVIQLATRSVPVPAGLFVVLLGVFFQVDRLEILDVNFRQLVWPLIIIAVGAYLVLNRAGRRSPLVHSQDRLDSFVMFGGVERRVESQAFQGGSATSLFGGTEIDLRGAKLHPEGANLDLTAAFGAIEISVPEDWKLNMTGLPSSGAGATRPAGTGKMRQVVRRSAYAAWRPSAESRLTTSGYRTRAPSATSASG